MSSMNDPSRKHSPIEPLNIGRAFMLKVIDPTIVNDLRLRVLAGEDISAEEMFQIIEQIRGKRRSAASQPKATKKAKRLSPQKLDGNDLEDLLNAEI